MGLHRTAKAIVASFFVFLASHSAVAQNYSDIWWNPSESGWGLTLADHETQIFAVWFTYRQDGGPTWFVIPGGSFSQGRRLFNADIYQTRGPAYNTSFNPTLVTPTRVGTASFDFAPPALASGTALFSYSIGGVSQTKQIQRQPFGDSAPGWGWDYTDIWWDPSESGWGLTMAQHGNNIFAVWYTYDTSGQPTYFIVSGGVFSGPDTFTGDVYTTTGPWYGNPQFDTNQVRATRVGTATLGFGATASSANAAKAYSLANGRFVSTILNFTQTKYITPQPFGNRTPTSFPAPPARYQLFVTTTGTGRGTVTSAPAGINCGPAGGPCGASFTNGSLVTLNASPDATSRFAGFGGTCSSLATSCSMSMSAIANVTASFDRLLVASTLAITPLVLPDATAGAFYAQPAASATGGAPPYHYQLDTLANGGPPLGMGIDLNGNLSGTPSTSYTTSRSFTFGVCVVDIVATTKCAQASVTVNPPTPVANGSMSWTMIDQCNNGNEIHYRFFDRANDMQWPTDRTFLYFMVYGDSRRSNLSCVPGAQVCYGAASSGSITWGVGLSGTAGCPSCCQTCDGGSYSRTLTCPGVGGSTSYYANWTCGSSGQCASVMGGSAGTRGPFCGLADCQRWGNQFIPAGYACSTSASYSPVPGGSSCYTYP